MENFVITDEDIKQVESSLCRIHFRSYTFNFGEQPCNKFAKSGELYDKVLDMMHNDEWQMTITKFKDIMDCLIQSQKFTKAEILKILLYIADFVEWDSEPSIACFKRSNVNKGITALYRLKEYCEQLNRSHAQNPTQSQPIKPQNPTLPQQTQPQQPQQQTVGSVANSINPNQYSASNIFAQLLKPQQQQIQQQVVNPFQQILQPQAPVPPMPMNGQVQEPIIEFDPLPGKSLKEKATILKNYYKFLGNHPNMTKENVDSLYSYATNNDLIQKIMKCNPKCGANIIMQEIPIRDKYKANYDFCFRVDVDDTHWVRVLVNSNQTIVRDYNNQLRKIPSGYNVTLVTKKNNK